MPAYLLHTYLLFSTYFWFLFGIIICTLLPALFTAQVYIYELFSPGQCTLTAATMIHQLATSQ